MEKTRRRITAVSASGVSYDAQIIATATDSKGLRFAVLRLSGLAGGRFLGYFEWRVCLDASGEWMRGGPHVPPKALTAIAEATPGERIKASGRWWLVGDPYDLPSRLTLRT